VHIVSRRDDDDPGLPLKLWPCSNGEFVPPPLDTFRREAMRRARQLSDDAARRLGWSRRRFLRSSCGLAAGLVALQSCSDDQAGSGGAPSTTARRAPGTSGAAQPPTTPGGTFSVPPEAVTEPEVATTVVRATEAVIDVQNHFLDYELHPEGTDFGSGFPQASCGEADARDCFSVGWWSELVFRQSDTAMAVLSAIPVVGEANPLSIDAMERGRAVANELCGDERVLIQAQAVPDVGPIDAALEAMAAVAEFHQLSGWKVYTHSPNGWFLDDHDPDLPAVGEAFLAHVEAIGPPVVAVHKGLAGGSQYASPVDIGPAAARHPGISFLVYHSGFEHAVHEGPYDPDGGGVDRLVRSLADTGLAPGSNVYAELGSTWRRVMGDPDQAAHVLGKLLLAVGEDNVLWGTDSIWYGSPQDQIAALRSFEIAPQLQEQFGYPALTPEVKAKILGGNAARLLGVEPPAAACTPPGEGDAAGEESALGNVTLGPVSRRDVLRAFVSEHPWVV
jgi:hypothetical protein